jgi:hypothetical protein
MGAVLEGVLFGDTEHPGRHKVDLDPWRCRMVQAAGVVARLRAL